MEFDLQRAGEPGKTATYIHGTRPEEQERLALLNDLTNKAFLEFLDVQPGSHVLDVGSGLGLLADGAASSAPSVRVTGLEKSFAQISAATKAAAVAYVQGDAAMLPFGDRCFDLACARYVLEHVADPEGVLREMRRVTRTGGRVAVCENDESLIRMDPVCPAFQQVWNAFQNYQSRLGGDSHIGSRLYRLFRSAGFSKIELSVQPEVHWYGKPTLSPWVRNIIGNIESARAGLIDSGMCSRAQIDEAVAELGALLDNTHASSVFVWNRAMAEA
jgi:ubiquinone/menaquinone biosynthesis C-methylase UbiE